MGVYKYYGYMYNQGIAGTPRNDARHGYCKVEFSLNSLHTQALAFPSTAYPRQ